MDAEKKNKFNVAENSDIIERYNILKDLGKTHFGHSESLKEGKIEKGDVILAKNFLGKGAHETNPSVWASYWEHTLIAPEYGKRIAEAAKQKGLAVNPAEVEFSLWLHDIGRLVTPGAYFRNDLIGDRILQENGIPMTTRNNFPSIRKLMATAEELDLKDTQLKFQDPLTPDQQQNALQYFDSLAPTQRIINLADNLGKRGPNGLFDLESFLVYLKSQEGRYNQNSDWGAISWAIPRRQAGAVLQAFTIEKTASWLKELGVDLNDTKNSLENYGPKFIAVVRHGDLYNPSNIVYNRDTVMNKEDIIHLGDEGKEQMQRVATLINNRKFNPVKIFTSPETRALESTHELNSILHVDEVTTVADLDDGFAPGPYLEKMTMDQLMDIGGNVYDSTRWGKYYHESPKEIIERMQRTFYKVASGLKVGETGLLLSHGDPIAWLLNTLTSTTIPSPENLRQLLYPAKGEGAVAIIDPQGFVFSTYTLKDKSIQRGKIY